MPIGIDVLISPEEGCTIWTKKEDNMDKKDKPLSEWTLGECKRYCDEQSEYAGMYADACQEVKGGCVLLEAGICEKGPSKWELETANDTFATDTNVACKPAKPRLAEALGVEVGEFFKIKGKSETYFVDEDGFFRIKDSLAESYRGYYTAINHPESIIRAPRLTEAELERCRVYNAKYITRDPNVYLGLPRVYLWKDRPERDANGDYNSDDFIAGVDANYFPSVHPGDCICVEEAGGK